MANNGAKNEQHKVGGGHLAIPVGVVLPKPKARFTKPVDLAMVEEQMQESVALVQENLGTLVQIGDWLIGFSAMSEERRGVLVEQARICISDLKSACVDPHPAIKRAGAYQTLRWRLAQTFTSWEEVHETVDELVKQSLLMKVESRDQGLIRCGRDDWFTIDPRYGLEPVQVAEFEAWVARIDAGIKSYTARLWENQIGEMEQAGNLTLEQFIDGESGLCHIIVPRGSMMKEGRSIRLDGGHILVSSSDGRITVLMACGNPATGEGFAFARFAMQVKNLIPAFTLSVRSLAFQYAFPKWGSDMNEASKKAKAFFDSHPEHAKACTFLHSVIIRAIKALHDAGEFDNELGGDKSRCLFLPKPGYKAEVKAEQPKVVKKPEVKAD